MWSSIHLDSDPLNRRHSGDTVELWIQPGFLTRALMLSAFPAFLIGRLLVSRLARFGISEVTSFMVSMPILIAAWFYGVAWMADVWIVGKILLRRDRARTGTD
jgi:hypothetical protein